MNKRKRLAPILAGVVLIGVGYTVISLMPKKATQEATIQNIAVADTTQSIYPMAERYKLYEPFGMTYDVAEDKLFYNNQPVRWFEDYYTLGDENEYAGIDFFNEEGSIDVYALRDLEHIEYALDGSYDPSGTLLGVQAFSEEEFNNRDIANLKASQTIIEATATSHTTEINPNALTLAEKFEPYKTVGIRYEESVESSGRGNVYYNEQLVHQFVDISPQNGTFTFESKDSGIFDVQVVYNQEGQMTGIEILK